MRVEKELKKSIKAAEKKEAEVIEDLDRAKEVIEKNYIELKDTIDSKESLKKELNEAKIMLNKQKQENIQTNFNISKNINYLEKQSPRTRFTLIELTKQESASHLLTRTVNDRTQVRKIYVVQNKSGTNIHAVRTSKHRKVHIHIVRRSQVVLGWICMKV